MNILQKPTAASKTNKAGAQLCFFVFSLLALSGCGSKPPQWDGEFKGTVEERLEERVGLTEHRTAKDFGVKENFTVSAATDGERGRLVTFGDCKLRFHSDKTPPKEMFEAPPGQICKISFGGYSGDFEMSGVTTLLKDKQTGKDRLGLTLTGYSLEKVPALEKWRMKYSYSFQGERR